MSVSANSELQELVDSPNETLDVEYKEWLDLENAEARADLARHICAMANHGGGNIVFGITNAMQPAGPNPFPKVVYHRDLIAGIVKKYLEPSFQCDVQIVKSSAGIDHPAIIIPPHGAAPICAKAGDLKPEVSRKASRRGSTTPARQGPRAKPS